MGQNAWAKTLRKLNAHESQRCTCNPNATRVSSKAKAEKRKAVDELTNDCGTVLLKNQIEMMKQTLSFLQGARPDVKESVKIGLDNQIQMIQVSLAQAKKFVAIVTSDQRESKINAIKATKLEEEERARLLASTSEGARHIWTEPTFQHKKAWQMQKDNAIMQEEQERTLRMQVPADPNAEAVGVFWGEEIVSMDLTKDSRYASTSKIEEEERARRANDCLLQQRQNTRHQKYWPEFSRRITPSPSQPVAPSQPAAARCAAAHYSASPSQPAAAHCSLPSLPRPAPATWEAAPLSQSPAVTPSDVALSDIDDSGRCEYTNLSMDMDSDDDFDWDLFDL